MAGATATTQTRARGGEAAREVRRLQQLAGPVPSLYSDDPDASLAGITSDPLKSHWDLQKISKSFFMAETVTVAEAVTMLKKPR